MFDNKKDFDWKNETELVLTLLDVLSCPYLNEIRGSNKYIFKKSILNLVGITKNHKHLIESEKFWFIKWIDFDFGMELQAKRSLEVY